MTLNIYEHINNQGEYSLRASREELPPRRNHLVGTLEGITKRNFERGERPSELILLVRRTLELQNLEVATIGGKDIPVEAYFVNIHEQGLISEKRLVLATEQQRIPFTGTREMKRYLGSKTQEFAGVSTLRISARVAIEYAGNLELSRPMISRILSQAQTFFPAKITYQPQRKHPPRKRISDGDFMEGI